MSKCKDFEQLKNDYMGEKYFLNNVCYTTANTAMEQDLARFAGKWRYHVMTPGAINALFEAIKKENLRLHALNPRRRPADPYLYRIAHDATPYISIGPGAYVSFIIIEGFDK